MSAPDHFAIFDRGSSRDPGDVEVLGKRAVFLGGGVVHRLLLEELVDLGEVGLEALSSLGT